MILLVGTILLTSCDQSADPSNDPSGEQNGSVTRPIIDGDQTEKQFISVTLFNQSGQTIKSLQMRPSGEEKFGNDLLAGQGEILPNGEFIFPDNLRANTVDIQIGLANHDVATMYSVPLTDACQIVPAKESETGLFVPFVSKAGGSQQPIDGYWMSAAENLEDGTQYLEFENRLDIRIDELYVFSLADDGERTDHCNDVGSIQPFETAYLIIPTYKETSVGFYDSDYTYYYVLDIDFSDVTKVDVYETDFGASMTTYHANGDMKTHHLDMELSEE